MVEAFYVILMKLPHQTVNAEGIEKNFILRLPNGYVLVSTNKPLQNENNFLNNFFSCNKQSVNIKSLC